MNRAKAIELLEQCKPVLVALYGVNRLALFGSMARDSGRDDSDIDVLVAFAGPASSKSYFGVQFLLEDALGKAVDLVTDKALRSELRDCVEREAIYV